MRSLPPDGAPLSRIAQKLQIWLAYWFSKAESTRTHRPANPGAPARHGRYCRRLGSDNALGPPGLEFRWTVAQQFVKDLVVVLARRRYRPDRAPSFGELHRQAGN